jgi:hypothetical protein
MWCRGGRDVGVGCERCISRLRGASRMCEGVKQRPYMASLYGQISKDLCGRNFEICLFCFVCPTNHSEKSTTNFKRFQTLSASGEVEGEGEKAMAVGVGPDVTVRVPGADVGPTAEKRGSTGEAGEKGPLRVEKAFEDDCVGFQVRSAWVTLVASEERGCIASEINANVQYYRSPERPIRYQPKQC